jgi:hypothetical protein
MENIGNNPNIFLLMANILHGEALNFTRTGNRSLIGFEILYLGWTWRIRVHNCTWQTKVQCFQTSKRGKNVKGIKEYT